MNSIDSVILCKAFIAGAKNIIDNETYLSELDGYVGDGDHGATAARGFRAVIDALENSDSPSPEEVFKLTGSTLAKSMGGAIGPIFGSIFSGAAPLLDGSEVTLESYAKAMTSGLDFVKRIGGAKEGDRTLVDALAPYSASLNSSAEQNLDLAIALKQAAEAAEAGAESTKTMQATKGRARFLGEKSIGFRDAGASSFTCFVTGFSNEINS